jgi:hypothetical protein
MAKDEEKAKEESVYDEGGREDMLADDELSPEEEAFMKGYDEAEPDEDKEEKEEEEGEEEVIE